MEDSTGDKTEPQNRAEDRADDKAYKSYGEDGPPLESPGIHSRICSCLYKYTIGSCLYFKNEPADQIASLEEIELKSMTPNGELKDVTEEGVNEWSEEWRRENGRKADCKMKKRIQYHFKDHIKRWMDSDRRRFPWKLILHLLLVILVTTQVSVIKFE